MIGVIITLEESGEQEEGLNAHLLSSPLNAGSKLVQWDVVGSSVLDRFVHSLQSISPKEVAVLSGQPENPHRLFRASQYTTPTSFYSSWEEAAHAFIAQGVQTLLLVKLDHYIDLDLPDLLQFHYATSSKLTQVFIGNQPVSVVVAQTADLRGKGISLRRQLASAIPQRRRYQFSGYFNPLRGFDDLRRLSSDALGGQCHLRPIGSEIASRVYTAEDASIHPTTILCGPAYIGARTTVTAGCTISKDVNIERDCEIDCGTTITNSSLTRNTYVGPGLNLKNAVAGPGWLYNMEHRTVVTIHDRTLLGSTHSSTLLTRAKSFLSNPWRPGVGSTLLSQSASLYSPSRWELAQQAPPEDHFKWNRQPQAGSEENPSR